MSFNVPGPIRKAFEEVASGQSVKEKWAFCSAAILMFLNLSEEKQEALFRRVKDADFNDETMVRIIDSAKQGELLTPTTKPGPVMKKAAKQMPGN